MPCKRWPVYYSSTFSKVNNLSKSSSISGLQPAVGIARCLMPCLCHTVLVVSTLWCTLPVPRSTNTDRVGEPQ